MEEKRRRVKVHRERAAITQEAVELIKCKRAFDAGVAQARGEIDREYRGVLAKSHHIISGLLTALEGKIVVREESTEYRKGQLMIHEDGSLWRAIKSGKSCDRKIEPRLPAAVGHVVVDGSVSWKRIYLKPGELFSTGSSDADKESDTIATLSTHGEAKDAENTQEALAPGHLQRVREDTERRDRTYPNHDTSTPTLETVIWYDSRGNQRQIRVTRNDLLYLERGWILDRYGNLRSPRPEVRTHFERDERRNCFLYRDFLYRDETEVRGPVQEHGASRARSGLEVSRSPQPGEGFHSEPGSGTSLENESR